MKDPSKPAEGDNLEEWRCARVPFGVNASAFLLAVVIKAHLQAAGTETAHKILGGIYMDDVSLAASSPAQALTLYQEGRALFKEAMMNLVKWASSDAVVRDAIPEADRASSTTMGFMGNLWDSKGDSLAFKVK